MTDLVSWGFSPAWPIILAGIISLFLTAIYARKGLMILAALAGLFLLVQQPMDLAGQGLVTLFGQELSTFRFDGLARIFGLVFLIATILNTIYAWHEDNRLTDGMAMIYAGAAIGAVFAGDFVTLFVFWELTALSSVFLIWASRNRTAFNAGMRYLAIQVTSGVLLLAGALVVYNDTGSLNFGALDAASTGGLLILIAFGIKAAFPLLHSWLPDSYPRATVTGTVVLSAFTTKLAIYALARGFAGYEPLLWVGAVMVVFTAFYAMMEDDLRKVLTHSLNNQLGFMVVGVGIGSAAALNGAAAHAFVSVIYQGLLFMGIGAVMHRTGTARISKLGGLYRTMPLTTVFTIIGALSIIGMPLFSGYVAKSFVLNELAKKGELLVWAALLFGSVAAVAHTAIKVPYFAFFGKDSGLRPGDAPGNMLIAMFLASLLCVVIGVFYPVLYALLPYQEAAAYQPYKADSIIKQLQLIVGAAFVVALLMRVGLYARERALVILDSDWLYRALGFGFVTWLYKVTGLLLCQVQILIQRIAIGVDRRMHALFAPSGALNKAVPSVALASWTALILAATMAIAFFAGG